MRVRLAMPLLRQKPKLELTMPGPAAETEPAAIPTPSAPRNNPLSNLFKPRLRPPVTTRSRTRLDRDEVFSYNEPVQPRRSSSPQGPWMSMLAAWSPSAAGVSSLFAVLFLFSAATIFLSAPSTMSYRTPSFRWGNLRSAIRNRAVLMVEDDFRSGLNGWSFPSGKSQDWSYDQAGFLRPGKLGFLQDSMKLTNYRLELMGQIERKSLGWAFRAKDENNYYVAKLTISRPGPLPMVDRMSKAYGTRLKDLLGGADSLPALGRHFGAGLYEAEVRWLAEREYARTAEDVLWRRTKLGLRFTPAQAKTLETWLSGRR